ncbi:MAG: hypothetical protein SVK08_01845 [Halobacteriota archaeon]|nr:hypothetical protein [Halobacteriota archaeon]
MLDILRGLHGETSAFRDSVAISDNATASDLVAGAFVHDDPAADGVILATATNVTNGDPVAVVWDGYSHAPGEDTVTIIRGKIMAYTDHVVISVDIETDYSKGDHLTIGADGKLTAAALVTDPFCAIVREVLSDKILIETV